jgi:hypothetical protein
MRSGKKSSRSPDADPPAGLSYNVVDNLDMMSHPGTTLAFVADLGN